MENKFKNTDDLIRDKFESYAPTPPPHVWPEVEKSIESKTPLIPVGTKRIIGAAAILLLAASIYFFNPFEIGGDTTDENMIFPDTEETTILPVEESKVEESPAEEEVVVKKKPKTRNRKPEIAVVDEPPAETDQFEIKEHKSEFGSGFIGSMNMKHTDFELSTITRFEGPITRSNFEETDDEEDQENEGIVIPETEKTRYGSWKIALNIWPELTMSNIDSVEVLNSFNLNVEPTYLFSKHWFVRSGIGGSYVRDRGFARMKYVVKEYMGSYEDVYDVTFDTVNGNIIPTYYTKTVEVWDSVPHVVVTSVTNKYIYLHVPLLLGYSSNNESSPFNWYAYAGPVIYFKASSWIDEP